MSLTPVGDYLRRRYPPNDGATHYLGAADDPGCCAGPHPACTYDSGWREALRSYASELREMAAAVLPQISTTGSVLAVLAASSPNTPAQVSGRLLLDLADAAERRGESGL